MHFKAILSLLPLLPFASAICAGYNFAFFSVGSSWYYTSDDACKIVVTGRCSNVCDCHSWGCGPDHSVNKLLVNGLWYKCRHDSLSGKCGNTGTQIANKAPESCCRNDGGRNLQEGLISKRHADAIEETNALLERHEQEYEDAEKRGDDLAKVRRRQLGEVEEYMKREAEAEALGDE